MIWLILIAGWVLNVAFVVWARPPENRSPDEKILDPIVFICCVIPYVVFILGLFGAACDWIDRKGK